MPSSFPRNFCSAARAAVNHMSSSLIQQHSHATDPSSSTSRRKKCSDDMVWFIHLPMRQAAMALGMSCAKIRRTCRRNGIQRWPSRKVYCICMFDINLHQSISISVLHACVCMLLCHVLYRLALWTARLQSWRRCSLQETVWKEPRCWMNGKSWAVKGWISTATSCRWYNIDLVVAAHRFLHCSYDFKIYASSTLFVLLSFIT